MVDVCPYMQSTFPTLSQSLAESRFHISFFQNPVRALVHGYAYNQPLNPLVDHRIKARVIRTRDKDDFRRIKEGTVELIEDRVDTVANDEVMFLDPLAWSPVPG